MYLSVVIPCFNEERALPRLHDALAAVLSEVGRECEVILVDDGSTDGTLIEARRLAFADRRVRYLALSRNFGKEAAVLAGLRDARGERVAIMDADLQHPPELLSRMLALMDSGCDQVVARRSREGDPLLRSLLSRMYYRALNALTDIGVQDGAGDFRVLSRRAVDAVLSLDERNRFSKGLFGWIGFDTATVPFRGVPRSIGRSKWSLGKLVNYGIDGLVSFNSKPLRLSVYLGLLVAVLAGCYMAFVVVHTLVNGVRVPGYTTLLVAVAGLGGLHLLFLGVLGEYLGRIYVETKRRPHFLVKESGGGLAPTHAQRLESLSRAG
ncbi:glycosyltransferase involved in cell wall biosynthesis [Saccharopolyspora erythraea NRRL 2338]|uniref:Stress response protein, glycosyl transferase family 2 n=2 Tax=Saccharopolyspora erythraea TaxID=1836 RepID=A4FK90_SACEN|nr:glycosyltransferase family 2 protein [Saccharopolyspora erythraea]EQD85252.1 glycosyltransferase [Saccharopolyspora erythraea D]PFG98105.1 glycosyltransferase involved in cell wall biosynthesis [Saccharopolyspora erythraea NRRL 2338]QRK88213.1 glycosyltransferase family 2 protein [Saccharopolyspora erythraea]CAM04465.1 stress response protein, glycosyl transferase family 2 [Saccharopolyspora erythraea NRRL 2338]